MTRNVPKGGKYLVIYLSLNLNFTKSKNKKINKIKTSMQYFSNKIWFVFLTVLKNKTQTKTGIISKSCLLQILFYLKSQVVFHYYCRNASQLKKQPQQSLFVTGTKINLKCVCVTQM